MLADKAGVSRQSVHTHIDLLNNLGIVRAVEGENHTEYTLNDDDEIVKQLVVSQSRLEFASGSLN